MLAMMLCAAVVGAQGPVSDKLQNAFQGRQVERDVADRTKDLQRPQPWRIRKIQPPAALDTLRAAGVGSFDVVEEVLQLGEASDAESSLRALHGLWAGEGSLRDSRVPDSLDSFEREIELISRDLQQALGSGREPDRSALRFQSAVEQVLALPDLGSLDKDASELVEERIERLETVDVERILHLAVRALRAGIAMGDPELLARARRMDAGPPRALEPIPIRGDVLVDRDTRFGRFVVGGFGDNRYDCTGVDVIIDLGGNDTYVGPAGGVDVGRRLSVVVDVAGDDTYEALNSGLGSATLGLGVLLDLQGKDEYTASGSSAGYGAGGVGAFFDLDGDDRYTLGALCGGVGLAGMGLFYDARGNDILTATGQSLGCGLPGGLGLFVDAEGRDERRILESPEMRIAGRSEPASFGFGAGVGLGPLLPGGLGVFVDEGAADDIYEASSLVLGCGLRGGVGLMLERGGDDVYRARVAACGAAYLGGAGIMIDSFGADTYELASIALGSGIAGGSAWFADLGGADRYSALFPAMGVAQNSALAVCYDAGGRDRYALSQGPAWEFDGWRERGRAIGLFFHEGGAEDEYVFRDLDSPANGDTLVVENGSGKDASLIIQLDR